LARHELSAFLLEEAEADRALARLRRRLAIAASRALTQLNA
jgi:hypothetical protein